MDDWIESSWPPPPSGAGQTNVFVTAGGEPLDFIKNSQMICSLLFRHVFLALLGTALYAATIAIDVCVGLQDIKDGQITYAVINLMIVSTPTLLFSLYMFFTSFARFNGSKAFCNAILWLLAIPLIPLFPVLRTTARIHHAHAATCNSKNQALHISLMNKPTSAHLLQFLQALLASAPQLVLRLHKVLAVYDGDSPFENVGLFTWLEWAQVGLGSVSVVLTVSVILTASSEETGTHSTRSLFDGSLALENVAGGRVIPAMLWVFFFLGARVPVLSLLIYYIGYWSLVFLVLHSLLLVALQTNQQEKKAARAFFVYIFSACLFIFVFIEINLTRRLQCKSAWITHVLFAAIALLEQSIILGTWFLVETGIIPKFSRFSMDMNKISSTNPTYFKIIEHDELILSVHYVLFTLSAIFMIITLCCRTKL